MTDLWSTALRRLSGKIAQQNFDMWLRPIECCSVDGHTLRLRAPNPYVRLWFESNYLDVVLDELRAETQREFLVEFAPDAEAVADVASGLPPKPVLATGEPATPVGSGPALAFHGGAAAVQSFDTDLERHLDPIADYGDDSEPSTLETTSTGSGEPLRDPGDVDGAPDEPTVNIALNPRYNFDAFVSGPSNQLAFAAAQAAATSYPPKYNPVFVCGGVGLGKTHLLHAIGHYILQRRPRARLCYISGERFMNEYVHAIRTNKMHAFRRRYREGADILLVDDVQFLAGKDGTQDEFFHTFNALHDSHRQIVLTADRKPHEISDIADRLRTRFAWGLLADIDPPELEVRVAILRKKAGAENIHLPDDVAFYIASSIKSNVRELEGALIRLAAYSSLSRREINIDFARETLEGSITRPPEHLSVEAILKAVAGYYNLKVADLKSPRRHKSVAGPRAVAMYLARTHTKDSYPDLGRAFGGKHHTTIISAVEKITKRLKDEPALRGEINAVETILLR